MLSLMALVFVASASLVVTAAEAKAAPPLSAPPADAPGKAKAYDEFVKDATVVPGLVPLVKKQGDLFFVLSKDALARDFIETSVPASGLGGFGPAAGEPYVAPARILRFERHDQHVVLRWPNTIAMTNPNTPEQAGVAQSLPSSVIDVESIVAENAANGDVVVSANGFLGDVANYAAVFSGAIKDPQHGYRLDPARTYFLAGKAFPENDVLRVAQTWAAADPNTIDVAPDARSLEIDMTYNLVAAPTDGYMPRIADPRVGYFEQPLLDFSGDEARVRRNVYYLARWNFAPKTPGQPFPGRASTRVYVEQHGAREVSRRGAQRAARVELRALRRRHPERDRRARPAERSRFRCRRHAQQHGALGRYGAAAIRRRGADRGRSAYGRRDQRRDQRRRDRRTRRQFVPLRDRARTWASERCGCARSVRTARDSRDRVARVGSRSRLATQLHRLDGVHRERPSEQSVHPESTASRRP